MHRFYTEIQFTYTREYCLTNKAKKKSYLKVSMNLNPTGEIFNAVTTAWVCSRGT